MLNSNYISKIANKIFQKFKVNLESLSEIMVLGKPCNLNISFMKTLATYMALKVDATGEK
jgi:hypothetical protein